MPDLPPIAQHRRFWYRHRFFTSTATILGLLFCIWTCHGVPWQKFHTDVYEHGVLPKARPQMGATVPKLPNPRCTTLWLRIRIPRGFMLKLFGRGDIWHLWLRKWKKFPGTCCRNALALLKEKPLPYTYQEPEMSWKKIESHSTIRQSLRPLIQVYLVKRSIRSAQSYDHTGALRLCRKSILQKSNPKLLGQQTVCSTGAFVELLAFGSIINEATSRVHMSG